MDRTIAPTPEELYRDHVDEIVRLVSLLGADDPHDVAAEAFARFLERREPLRDEQAALAWIRSTACNLSRTRWRHRVVARRAIPRLVPVGASGPDELAGDADELRRLNAVIEGLPTRQREVMVLRFWVELDEREIASTLGISAGSVKQHASRAMARIKRELTDGR